MTENKVKRKLAAILCADVKGYSRLMGEDEVGTFHILSEYLEIIKTKVSRHNGRVFSSPGDAILAQFDSVVDAVQCAVEVQEKIEANNSKIPEDRKMQFRIGINIGDVIEKGNKIYGNGVNIAARLEGLADPGGICISKTALEQIEDKLPWGYEYLGKKTVKNISKPVLAYRVLFEIGDGTPEVKVLNGSKGSINSSKSKKGGTSSRNKVSNRSIFYKHVWIYLAVNCFLIVINLLTLPDFYWFYWPALIWGLLIIIHWIVWVKDSSAKLNV